MSNDILVHHGQIAFSIRADASALAFMQLEWPARRIVSELTLPIPSSGYGGAVLSISPNANYAAALLYSGQSELGYELFALTPRLQHIGGLAYIRGESDLTPVQFSHDESVAAVAIEENPWWWVGSASDNADWDTPAPGGQVEWAALYVHNVECKHPARVGLVVDLAPGWHPPSDGTWPLKLRFESARSLSLELPWNGRIEISIPLTVEPIVVTPPLY